MKPHTNMKRLGGGFILAVTVLLTGCAGPKYTVDDGSAVDEKLLSTIKTYGKASQIIRPAVVKTAELKDEGCSTDYELPFAVADSYDLPHMDKIAWVRGLGVDERLTVISVGDPATGLTVGDKIEELDGYSRENTEKMRIELEELRDDGDDFEMKLAGGKKVKIKPLKVCRGLAQIAAAYKPEVQDYHWLKITHPLSIFEQDITPDEAMWMVLWTQGLSEEAGMRMKTYHYGVRLLKTGITIASIASGVGAVANAASSVAAQAAAAEAGKQAAQAAGKAVTEFAAQQAIDSVRNRILEAGKELLKSTAQDVALDTMKTTVLFRNSLSGISWVGSTGFYMADKWAFDRMAKLGYDPMAAFTLHFKLASNAKAGNAFVFDDERAGLMLGFAGASGFGDQAKYALTGSFGNDVANGDAIHAEAATARTLDDVAEAVAEILPATSTPVASTTGGEAVPAVATSEPGAVSIPVTDKANSLVVPAPVPQPAAPVKTDAKLTAPLEVAGLN